MERTLLDIVQGILSTLDSDEVNSVSETVESDQVCDIVKKVYYDIIDEYQLPGSREIRNLEALGDLNKPNVLRLPTNTQSLLHWSYDCRQTPTDSPKFTELEYRTPDEFLRIVNMRDASDTTQYQSVTVAPGITLTVDKKNQPRYWTSFDDEYVVCDNYDQSVDATLQASKTQAWIEMRPTFLKEDSYVPILPSNLHGLLYRTAENECYALFKQAVNPVLNRQEGRLRIRAQRNKHRSQQSENNIFNGAPNYGRRTR